ncbi:hypothetical protein [Candidatus Marimicrobium litorale]|uniref:hypothetical protein n=1 Tax=Candidatus Marimicrobium litorale TaxID=2518991 RepID=UPI00242B7F6B|nr:hypothetical protein [Candidatus Marimicrobium litorale]
MFSLLLEVTAIFLMLFVIVPILFMAVFMRLITQEKDEHILWGKDDDTDIVNH